MRLYLYLQKLNTQNIIIISIESQIKLFAIDEMKKVLIQFSRSIRIRNCCHDDDQQQQKIK